MIKVYYDPYRDAYRLSLVDLSLSRRIIWQQYYKTTRGALRVVRRLQEAGHTIDDADMRVLTRAE